MPESSSNRPLKIGVLVNCISRNAGGLFVSVRNLSQHLKANGHHVEVFSNADSHSDTDIDQWSPLRPSLHKAIGPKSFSWSPSLLSTVLRAELDVLHLHGMWTYTSVIAAQWSRKTGHPLVISPRGMLDEWALENAGIKKKVAYALYERLALNRAAALHALNSSEAKSIVRYLPSSTIFTLPNAITTVAADNKLRTDSQNADGSKTVLFLGRIHPKKGLLELVEAWSLAVTKDTALMRNWKLMIAGWDDGGHLSELEERISQLGLTNAVSICGPLFDQEKANALANADAFILNSYSEGLPMSVLEAWSYGLPVLMTDECNLERGFELGAALRITQEPSQLSRQLLEYLQRGDLDEIGSIGQKMVSDEFTWKSVSEQLEAVYYWLVDRGPKPDCVS